MLITKIEVIKKELNITDKMFWDILTKEHYYPEWKDKCLEILKQKVSIVFKDRLLPYKIVTNGYKQLKYVEIDFIKYEIESLKELIKL